MHLHLITKEDIPAFYETVKDNYDHIKDYLPKTSRAAVSVEAATETVERYLIQAERNEAYTFLARTGENATGIACIVFLKEINEYHSRCEIGYFTAREQQGRGIATFAVQQAVAFAFDTLQLNKICCKVAIDNHGSRTVAAKNGFMQEGLLRQDFKTSNGLFTDIVILALLRTDRITKK